MVSGKYVNRRLVKAIALAIPGGLTVMNVWINVMSRRNRMVAR